MRTFFLFYIVNFFLRNPFLAIIVVLAIVYLSEARYSGRYFNPAFFAKRRSAVQELKQAVADNDHDVASHNDLGRLLADAGGFTEAAEHMSKAIVRMEESPETNFYYGLCLLRTGNATDGRRFIEQALEINPRYSYGKPQLVLAREAFERGDNAAALDWAERAVKLNTSSVEGWVLVGEAQLATGDAQGAAQAFKRAKSAFTDLPHYLKLGEKKWLREAKRATRTA
jgi:tetratricopeptide (TPR) repeat protein